jgi:hypothetical protein
MAIDQAPGPIRKAVHEATRRSTKNKDTLDPQTARISADFKGIVSICENLRNLRIESLRLFFVPLRVASWIDLLEGERLSLM